MSSPTELPRWATGGGAIVTDPTSAKKDIGWKVSEKPPSQFLNWWMKLVYSWILYFSSEIRIFSFREAWMSGPAGSGTSGGTTAGGDNSWYYQSVNNGTTTIDAVAAGFSLIPVGYPFQMLQTLMQSTNLSFDYVSLRFPNVMFVPAAPVAVDAVFEAMVTVFSNANHVVQFWGFTDLTNPNPRAVANCCMVVADPQLGNNWFLRSGDGTTVNAVDSGIPVVTGRIFKFRLQIEGSTTSFGAMSRLTVTDTTTLTSATVVSTINLPTVAVPLNFWIGQYLPNANATVLSRTFTGPVFIEANSFASAVY